MKGGTLHAVGWGQMSQIKIGVPQKDKREEVTTLPGTWMWVS